MRLLDTSFYWKLIGVIRRSKQFVNCLICVPTVLIGDLYIYDWCSTCISNCPTAERARQRSRLSYRQKEHWFTMGQFIPWPNLALLRFQHNAYITLRRDGLNMERRFFVTNFNQMENWFLTILYVLSWGYTVCLLIKKTRKKFSSNLVLGYL